MTGLLRDELGYRGVVVSDDLDMKAIADHYGIGEAAVQAVEAGCDVVLLCEDPDNQELAFDSLVRAAESRAGFHDRVQAAAASVRKLKRTAKTRQASRPATAVALGAAGKEPFAIELAKPR